MSEKRSTYNAGYVLEMPVGLERAVARVLDFHVGRGNAISRADLLNALYLVGFGVDERVAREAVNKLRKEGRMICSTGGKKGGYWMAADWKELNEYIEREVDARTFDLLMQKKALRAAAEKVWGRFSPEKQIGMGI